MKEFKRNRYLSGFIALTAATTMLAGCGPKQEPAASKAPEVPVMKDPVDIVFYSPQATRTTDQFMTLYGNDIKEKFPNVNVKFVEYGKGMTTPDLLTSGQTVDIIMSTPSTISELTKYGLQYDISDLIKKYNYDLNRLEPSLVEFMKEYAGGGMYGLPTNTDTFALFYNKSLFDKFGVAYPKEGMTWDQVYDLAKTLTRSEGGVQYYGFTTSVFHILAYNQLSAPYYDLKANKVVIAEDKFKTVVNNFSRFFELAGPQNAEEMINKYADLFKKDQRAAMYAYYGVDLLSNQVPFDWDVVSMPYFKEAQGVAPQFAPSYMSIAGMSKHKDEAFQILAYLTSDEYQTKISKIGKLTSLKSSDVRKVFAQNQDAYKGKNLKPYAPEKTALITPKDELSGIASSKTTAAFKQIVTGQKDVNTALREAAEAAQKDIDTAKTK
ncbi:extracellular solute-binding protein [Paenibacillus sp. RC67]|uniref:ABC transporter substrate-binding protein n=1 Tax=Paenibacillus sp. RC67 TaxID=3039392 RepID=UPI0024AD8703|nr:extracellular solute-binding protein [Paenibacillus sp. RC67]